MAAKVLSKRFQYVCDDEEEQPMKLGWEPKMISPPMTRAGRGGIRGNMMMVNGDVMMSNDRNMT